MNGKGVAPSQIPTPRRWRWQHAPRTHEAGSAADPNACARNSLRWALSARLATVKRLRSRLGLRCRHKRRFVRTTDGNHTLPIAPNLLEQKFDQTDAPNQVWLTDITYVPTDEGWLYVAAIKDLFTKKIVGWAMEDNMRTELVSKALWMAVKQERPMPGLIHHSDRGSQYASLEYRHELVQFGMRASMSRRGNCYDNAPMESFWASLKKEQVHHQHYKTRAQARADIFDYIETFYNPTRRHSSLGFVSPVVFEKQHTLKGSLNN